MTTRPATPVRPVDGSFITGRELSAGIRYVLGGSERCCAVAFWGRGSRGFLEAAAGTGGLRIVCDLSMGGCHPDALRSLGAPGDPTVRHRDGLHAKAYLSDRGVVIGSANASDNGIGFGEGGAALIEAGSFHAPGSAAWSAASAWFEALHADAAEIDQAALSRAAALHLVGRREGAPATARPGSLLDAIVSEPERFDGVGVVIANSSASAEERADARRSAVRAGVDRVLIERTGDVDMFVDWSQREVLRWPVTFFEFWMPSRRLHIYPRVVTAVDPAGGSVLTRRSTRALRRLVSGDLPDLREAERRDAAIVAALGKGGGRVFRTARELATAIETTTA